VKESNYNVWVDRPDGAYVFNGVSGALLRVPTEQRVALDRLLTGGDRTGCSTDIVRELAVGRMLVADGTDELELLKARYEASRRDGSHFGLTIVTSLGCNFDCPYCFEAKHPSILSPDVERAVLAVLDEKLPVISGFDVTWFGGEPLVGKRPLLALSDAFIERCDAAAVAYSASITTNGYLLTRETCEELRDRRVSTAQVGLDGPPDIHNAMRPLASGGDSFWRIIENLHHAIDYLDVSVRVNIDSGNVDRIEELFRILADQDFAGKLHVYPGHIVGVTENPNAPSTQYQQPCFTSPEFAAASLEFERLARQYGLARASVPQPLGTPCTAVRANELVVGSNGELYKCWDSVGTEFEVIGHIDDYQETNGRLQRWLKYDPFSNEECRSCVALPVCMGGCAHHAMALDLYDNRCGTFRHNYHDQVLDFVNQEENPVTRGRTNSGVAAGDPQPVSITTRA
jgi:uncharacterized protein